MDDTGENGLVGYAFDTPEVSGGTAMTNPFEDENGEYLVLVNHELQYSLWPLFREIPNGWTAVGPKGNRKECLDWIEATWTDMRPRSLVDAMEADMASRNRS